MSHDPQIMNVISEEIAGTVALYKDVFKLKEIRGRIVGLGIDKMTDEQIEQALFGDKPRESNNLSHMTGGKIRRLLAAYDVLDAAFLTIEKLDGVDMPPMKAIVDVIR